MIWSSLAAMIILDVIIIGLVLTMIGVSWYLGMFRKWRVPRTGRFLMIAGVSLTGLFYLADLLLLTALPHLMPPGKAMALLSYLHLEVRWVVSLVSIILVSTGIVIEAFLRERLEKQLRRAETHISDAHDRIIESEMRFRSVIEQTPDSLYCFEFDPPFPVELSVDEQIERSYSAILVECNEQFAHMLLGQTVDRTLGMRFGEMESAHDTQSHSRLFREFIKQGYRLVDYKQTYTNLHGEARVLRISMSGIVRNGKVYRIWGTERSAHEENRAKAALAGRLSFHQFLAQISSQLLTAHDESAEKTLVRCLEKVGRRFDADRAAIVCFDKSLQRAAERYTWYLSESAPRIEWSPQSYPHLWPKLVRGQNIAVTSVQQLSRTAVRDAANLADLGATSVIIVPLLVESTSPGACVLTNIADGEAWNEQDMSDLRMLTNLFASKLVQIDAGEDLRNALAELRVAKDRLEAENVYLREEISSSHGFHELVGESEGLLNCLRQVARVATTNTAVLLQGETGTGKELVARAIHERSSRKKKPLVKVNCAALPANLIESELFGHEKGAFTGAVARKLGRFDLADGGTLFLDEIADLPIELQSKLLRVLQSGEFERLGGDETRNVDVRVIAATNRDLVEAVQHGHFRSDLYYRINTFPITLPALRDRGDDVCLLAEHFVRKHSAGLGRNITEISSGMMDQLRRYNWPGNVRELEGIVQRALIYSSGPVLHLAKPLRAESAGANSPIDPVEIEVTDLRLMEREHIRRVLEQSKWVITGDAGAATKLGVPPSTLRSKMKKLGISRPH